MKFFIRSDKFIGFFRTPGQIQVGDTIYADSFKFSDSALTRPMGPSYAHYSVVDSQSMGNRQFRVKAMSQRVLDFLRDGVVTVSGVSEQVFTLSEDDRIVKSNVLSNTLTITGGSGKFDDVSGNYDVETMDNGVHVGHLRHACRKSKWSVYWICIILVAIVLGYFFLSTSW